MVSTQGDFCAVLYTVFGDDSSCFQAFSTFFAARTKESNTSARGGQPTVLFRVSASFSENAWICAPRSTDRDLQNRLKFLCECLDTYTTGKRP